MFSLQKTCVYLLVPELKIILIFTLHLTPFLHCTIELNVSSSQIASEEERKVTPPNAVNRAFLVAEQVF
jgi:hypothetical protein